MSVSSMPSAPQAQPAPKPASGLPFVFDRGTLATTLPIYLAIVAIWIFFQTQTDGRFIGPRNLSELAQEFAYKPVLSIGVVFVLLLGEIDLSVGYLTLIASTAVAVFSATMHLPAPVAILGAVAICALLGLAQGFLISVARMPAFVVTLGGFLIFEGMAFHILSGATINVPDPAIAAIGTLYLPASVSWLIAVVAVAATAITGILSRRRRAAAGLANPSPVGFIARVVGIAVVLIAIVAVLDAYRGVPISLALLGFFALIAWFVAVRTPFGRHVYAVGGNIEASRRAGINTVGIAGSSSASPASLPE